MNLLISSICVSLFRLNWKNKFDQAGMSFQLNVPFLMSESSKIYNFNDQSKFQMYEVFSTEVLNQVQESQFNIVEEKIAKKKTNRLQY